MPAERVSMRQAREIIRLKFSTSLPTREIARRLGLAPSTVRETLSRLDSAGLSWPLPEGIGDAELEAALYANRRSKRGHRRHAEPDWPAVHRELKRKHVTHRLGRIYRGKPRRLQLFALCCGPAYVSFSRGSLCHQEGRARLTQHKSGPRLANLTHAGVCHGSATFFRQRRRLSASRRAFFPSETDKANAIFVEIAADRLKLWIRGVTPEPFAAQTTVLERRAGGDWRIVPSPS